MVPPGEPDEGCESRHAGGCAALWAISAMRVRAGRPVADLGRRDGVGVGQGAPGGGEIADAGAGAGGVDEVGGAMLGDWSAPVVAADGLLMAAHGLGGLAEVQGADRAGQSPGGRTERGAVRVVGARSPGHEPPRWAGT